LAFSVLRSGPTIVGWRFKRQPKTCPPKEPSRCSAEFYLDAEFRNRER
jgi:hypothetical protein